MSVAAYRPVSKLNFATSRLNAVLETAGWNTAVLTAGESKIGDEIIGVVRSGDTVAIGIDTAVATKVLTGGDG